MLILLRINRHEKYQTQYRSMLVFNCRVIEDEQLRVSKAAVVAAAASSCNKKRRGKKNSRREEDDDDDDNEFETFKPVECETCQVEVGVYDPESEIYHFFNVLASHS